MIRSEDFLLRDVAGSRVLVPVGAAVDAFAGIVTLNGSGVLLWNALETEQTEATLAEKLMEKYDVSQTQAMADVEKFLSRLQEIGAVK